MDSILAIVQKEFLHLIRDKRTLKIIILMPFIQLLIYGFAIDTDVKHLATALYDEDQSPVSRRLVNAFRESAYFDFVKPVQSPAELRRVLDLGRVKVGIHIPPGFTRNLLAGRQATLQMLVDGSDSNPANVALNTGQAIVTSFMQKEGIVPIQVLPIDFRPRMWYNPDLKSSFFMIPGLVGLLLQMLIPMITAVAVVREKENGNIEQLLVTPVKPYEIILGKLIPYMGIALIIAITVIGAAHFMFHVPVRGNPLTLLVLTLLYAMVCLGIGLLASTLAHNQQQATQMVMLLMPPSILLSGFIFPRETMPWPIFYLGQLIPLTYYLKIVRGIILKGLGFADLWDQFLPLLIMATAILTISIRKFHKRLA